MPIVRRMGFDIYFLCNRFPIGEYLGVDIGQPMCVAIHLSDGNSERGMVARYSQEGKVT